MCNFKDISTEEDKVFHKLETPYGNIFVKTNEKFSFESDCSIYTLREDGNVYAIENISTYTYYIENPFEIYPISCLDYSNIGEMIPSFEEGERVIKLLPIENYEYESFDPSYVLNKNDSEFIQFQSIPDNDKNIKTVCYAEEITKEHLTCVKDKDGLITTNLKPNVEFDKAMINEYINLKYNADLNIVLELFK